MAPRAALTVEKISAQLDEWLEVEFSFLRTEGPAIVLSQLEPQRQDYILTWVQRISSTNIQLAYQFITQATRALDNLDKRSLEAWALHAMDTYDQSGLHPALHIIKNIDSFLQYQHETLYGSVYEDERGILLHFAHGLSGRRLNLDVDKAAWTDSETIYLPPLLARLSTKEDNFLLYKAMVAMMWAQCRYGTFRAPLEELCDNSCPDGLQRLFHSMETLRLEACIQRELPGLYRDMLRIEQKLHGDGLSPDWLKIEQDLSRQGACVEDSLRQAKSHFATLEPFTPRCYQGELHLQAVLDTLASRLMKEKAIFRTALFDIAQQIKGNKVDDENDFRFSTRKIIDEISGEVTHFEMTLHDAPMPVPENIKGLSTSILQDLGDIPDEYLQAAGPGEYDPALFKQQEKDPDDVWQGTYHEEGAFLYREWDYQRQHYRNNWCAVRERPVTPVYDDFVGHTLHRYHGLIKHLRRTFEAMRDEDRLLKRQANGEGIDIDALVEALADSSDGSDGSEMTDRLFTRRHRTERNIAVVFMVDMSGSTKGWINDAERESLLLLAEALETLGDRYSIYGFSGMARKRCEIYTIKTFDEVYNDEIKARISGIRPQDYTRMGFAIRHLSQILLQTEARTRILITISDGKPDDYNSYRGQYGIEDTRRALVEARRQGIHPYCITIDTEAKDYLPYMYGDAAYTVIDEVRQLPLKVSDIYRRLTT